jgi:hypothetical protein
MSRTSQPHDTASEAEDEFETWWRSLWRIFAVQWTLTLNNLCFFLFVDRQIPQILEFIEGGRPESSQYYVSITDAWQMLSAVPFRSAFRNCLLPPKIPSLCCIVLLTFDGHHYDVGLIWPNLIRLLAWNYRYSISDSLHSQPDKNAYKIQLIPLQRREMDLMLIRMRRSFHTGSLLEIKFVTFSSSLKRINVDIWTVCWMFPVEQ